MAYSKGNVPLNKSSDALRSRLVELYQSGMTMKESARHCGCSVTACWNALKDSGVQRRRNGDMLYRQNGFNEYFFEDVDSEEKAYFLGLIAADGCISSEPNRYRLTISLQHRDVDILEKFLHCLGCNKPLELQRSRGRIHSRLCLDSMIMISHLARLGIGPRKTFSIEPWQAPSHRPDLQAHYWRGAMDGDGGISHRGRQWQIDFCGSKSMVEAFAEFSRPICGAAMRVKPDKSIWTVRVGGVGLPQRLIKALYGNASIALNRKAKSAEELMACSLRKKSNTY